MNTELSVAGKKEITKAYITARAYLPPLSQHREAVKKKKRKKNIEIKTFDTTMSTYIVKTLNKLFRLQ